MQKLKWSCDVGEVSVCWLQSFFSLRLCLYLDVVWADETHTHTFMLQWYEYQSTFTTWFEQNITSATPATMMQASLFLSVTTYAREQFKKYC